MLFGLMKKTKAIVRLFSYSLDISFLFNYDLNKESEILKFIVNWRIYMKKEELLIHELEPVFDENSKILILGTFPSVKSRESKFFYAHPQNRFWKVLSALMEVEVPITIDEKKKFLLKNNIAVWDVIDRCQITGSSDSSIKSVVPSELSKILNVSKIERIFANGGTAKKLYEKYQYKTLGIEIEGLPSTSPANAAYSLKSLLEAWEIIKKYLN